VTRVFGAKQTRALAWRSFTSPTRCLTKAASAIVGLSAGHLTVNHTTVLLTAEEAMEAMRQAGETTFQRPS
jgi:hypothetical protein